ncbi:MAG: hypothetical protein CME06_01930 [Gemmatimonadetes bacterium]|nr:hypothetical protein [Gemmatimonadota bacterium]
MFRDDELEVWNLTPGGVAKVGALPNFNVLGRVEDVGSVREIVYSLNSSAPRPVALQRVDDEGTRLDRAGVFGIDSIDLEELRAENRLVLTVRRENASSSTREIDFRCERFDGSRFELDIEGVRNAEEIAQIVDGRWQIGRGASGAPCLEIAESDTGYDRIVLFGRQDWTTGYTISARISVHRITGPHNVGLLYKWNCHELGEGTTIPTTWNTGLGYYCSYGPGLRIRVGEQVHIDESGRKVGDRLLGQTPLSLIRRWRSQLLYRAGLIPFVSELALGRHYRFRLNVGSEQHMLTVWPAARKRPRPQIVVPAADGSLERGSVGIIAHRCAVRVHEYRVERD